MTPLTTLAASCPPLLQGALDDEHAEQFSRVLKVLADPARLRLMSLIAAQPAGEACGCHLTEPLGLSQPTVSHHLKTLREAGLLTSEQRGSWIYYRVVPDALAVVRGLLS